MRKDEAIATDSLPVTHLSEREASPAAGYAEHQPSEDRRPDRRLRTLIILANVVAWFLIIMAIRLTFF